MALNVIIVNLGTVILHDPEHHGKTSADRQGCEKLVLFLNMLFSCIIEEV
jgi:hypothetical protein